MYHARALERVNAHGDLRAVFDSPELRDPTLMPTSHTVLQLFSPFSPCLAHHASLDAAPQKSECGGRVCALRAARW